MAMTIGGKTPQSIEIGGKAVKSLAIGGEVVWSAAPIPDYLRLKNVSNESGVFKMVKQWSPAAPNLEYSLDGATWTTYDFTTLPEVTVASGANIYFRGTNANQQFNTNSGNYVKFSFDKTCEGHGNMCSLFDPDPLVFSTITSVGQSGLCRLFDGCTSLTTAPELPAMSVGNEAYSCMFRGCTSLVQAPELPATSVTDSSYYQMFYCCTALTTPPPVLPATSVAGYTYASMFLGCTSLTYSPDIYASPTSYYAFSDMFNGCTSLSEITVRSASWGTGIPQVPATTGFSSNVASTGTFYNLGGATIPTGTDGIPSGWTEHTSL